MKTYDREQFWAEARKHSPNLTWQDFVRRWNAIWMLAHVMGIAQKCEPAPKN